MALKAPIVVALTGAAGQIAYSLVFSLCKGEVFGPLQPIDLRLLDLPVCADALHGVAMELDDCAFPLLVEHTETSSVDEAFKDCDVALLIGALPRIAGMERKDLLSKNVSIFKVQGESLNRVAKKTVKVLVVGNPANTNALVTAQYAPSIPKSQFTCLTQLDQNRATSLIALRLKCSPKQIKNIIIWGNHSATQYPDVSHAFVETASGGRVSVSAAINDDGYLQGEFISTVQLRGAAVIKARKLGSALSAAKAIGDHIRIWWNGTAPGEFTSMGVLSDGSYDVPEGVVYSMPVEIKDGRIAIHKGLPVSDFSRAKMDASLGELMEEKAQALEIVNGS